MTRDTFESCYVWIEKFHGKVGLLQPEVKEEWWRRFKDEHDSIFCEATVIATGKMPPGFFPAISRMAEFITEAREKLWDRIKSAEAKAPLSKPRFVDNRNTERGRRWLKGILEVAEGKRQAADLIAEMTEAKE